MKKIILLVLFIAGTQIIFAQKAKVDSLLQQISVEKDDCTRFLMLENSLQSTSESDPLLDFSNLQQIYQYGIKQHDRIAEAFAISRIGYNYRSFGNTEKALQNTLDAVNIAQETECLQLQAYSKMNLSYVYKDLANYSKTISLLMDVLRLAEETNFYKAKTWAYALLAVTYLDQNKIDSALVYSQRCYELCIQKHYYSYLGYRLTNLGDVNARLGNNTLAIGYYDMAIAEGLRVKSPKQLNTAYLAKAQFFQNINQRDSSIYYAKKSVNVVQQTPFSNYALNPAKLLLDLYKPTNSDSALKYSEINRIANDSLYSTRAIQQTQSLSFEQELRQQKIEEERIKATDERHQNIQYALIAFAIITFIVIFLLFSRSVIANERMISFFGVLGLLVVFEFINLLLHPWLSSITHESPVLMLLALVLIAALLIPMHHRLEHWIKEKMVEKNKAIRLAAAKKTIEKLGDNS